MSLPSVAVVGSANLDVVMFLNRFAGPGETVLGDRLQRIPGGKGLNQAVAASRTSRCAFVGCVGDDDAGEILLARLRAAGVEPAHVRHVDGPSGHAFIQVTPDGENSIVVVPLANRSVSADVVTTALDAFRPEVVLAQLEIPLESVQAAADWTRARDARFLLNPSPVRPLPEQLLAACDPLILNLSEARMLLDEPPVDGPTTGDELVDVAGRLLTVARSAVVTAGPDGVVAAAPGEQPVHVPGHPADVVDTTGAGDELAGTLAAAIASGSGLAEAARAANDAAARVVALPRSRR